MASGLTPTYRLPYPIQTDPVDVASDVRDLAVAVDLALFLKAPLDSPQFTGVPVAPTASSDTNTTQIATTGFVINQGYLKASTATTTYAPIASPTFSGVATAPTPLLGDNSTKIATTAYVQTEFENFQPLPDQTGNGGKFLKTDGSIASWNQIATSDVTGLTTLINGLSSTYAPLNILIEAKTSTYTLVLTDTSKQIEMNSSSGNVLYIPTDASVDFPIGTVILVVQSGTGQTTIAASTPATTVVNGTPGLKLRTQWSSATLIKRAANNWLVSGDIIA